MLITISKYIIGRLCGFPTLELLLFSYYFLGSLSTFARRRIRLRKFVLEFCVERDRAEEKLTAQKVTGLLLRNLNQVTILGKPYYLLYIPIMVTSIKFLNSKPRLGTADRICCMTGVARREGGCCSIDRLLHSLRLWQHAQYGTGSFELR